jgi:hypothetical protein
MPSAPKQHFLVPVVKRRQPNFCLWKLQNVGIGGGGGGGVSVLILYNVTSC